MPICIFIFINPLEIKLFFCYTIIAEICGDFTPHNIIILLPQTHCGEADFPGGFIFIMKKELFFHPRMLPFFPLITGAAGFIPALLDPAICCLIALVCAMIVFLHIGWRNLIGTLLLIAAFACIYLKIEYANYIAAACGLIAVVINLKNAFLRKK